MAHHNKREKKQSNSSHISELSNLDK